MSCSVCRSADCHCSSCQCNRDQSESGFHCIVWLMKYESGSWCYDAVSGRVNSAVDAACCLYSMSVGWRRRVCAVGSVVLEGQQKGERGRNSKRRQKKKKSGIQIASMRPNLACTVLPPFPSRKQRTTNSSGDPSGRAVRERRAPEGRLTAWMLEEKETGLSSN